MGKDRKPATPSKGKKFDQALAADGIDPDVRREVLRRLAVIESEEEVRIVYACESGSRAWGFASPDSDYDVRFVYVHDREWYLSFDVERKRDVIERPIVDEIDCNGWDLRKALHLFTRTNGALLVSRRRSSGGTGSGFLRMTFRST